ncbi:MAG: hypothetical protein ACI4HO_08775 [Ruminococcus sp.]
MSGYIALKPALYNGKEYSAGETIPAEEIIPARIPALIRTGAIADATATEKGATAPAVEVLSAKGIVLPIQAENGVLELPASEKDIVTAIEVLQLKADDIPQAVSVVNSEEALIIIDALTKSQAVKKAVRARAEQLEAKAEETTEEA